MVVFDNLARILREILSRSIGADSLKEWKLLGQEKNGELVIGWIEERYTETKSTEFTCIGVYQPKTNRLQVLCKLDEAKSIVQASVNRSRSLVSYVVKSKIDEKSEGPDYYEHYLCCVGNSENLSNETFGKSPDPYPSGLQRQKQIMTSFLGTTPKDTSKLLVFIHLESILLYRLKTEDSEKVVVVKTDIITRSFVWAQWDCDIQSLYYIHFKKTSLPVEGEDSVKQEESPTLSCLQFHEDLPHETVLNIPLNLPNIPKTTETSCQTYEDDPLPLRIHDCSLDLIVLSDPTGTICICHHYLYQPLKEPGTENTKPDNTVHFAYSVTLLHHGCVIHSVVPGVPWHLAKTMRPVFALLGGQYLVVYAAGIFTHLLDVGLSHEPNCHILMSGTLSMVPQSASRLVPIKGQFTETILSADDTELFPSVMIDLQTMDLIEFEITIDDLMNCLMTIESVSNRLSILHYFLIHAADFESVEEVLAILLKNPTDVNVPKFFQEILIGGTYCLVRENLTSEAKSLLNCLPITSLEPARQTETKLNQLCCKTTQEVLWNTAMMLLSPQQRLIPFNTDIWKKLWDQLLMLMENSRFKPSQAVEMVVSSWNSHQADSSSACTTPVSSNSSHMDPTNVKERVKFPKENSRVLLPFLEDETGNESKLEHVINVNLREISLHLLKNCLQQPSQNVSPVATQYVAAQLEISKLLVHFLGKIAGIEDDMKTDKGFSLIKKLHQKQRQVLFTLYQRYYNAAETLAYPVPQGFTSFFCYLGFTSLTFQYFMMYLQNNVFELQFEVMKEIMQDIEDTSDGVNKKLRLLLLMPRCRAKRLLHNWPHGVSLMIRAREHALNILTGVQSSRCQGKSGHSKRTAHNSRGLAAFPSADRLSPLDTFLDLLTAKASLTDLDFNLLIDATISSTQDIIQ